MKKHPKMIYEYTRIPIKILPIGGVVTRRANWFQNSFAEKKNILNRKCWKISKNILKIKQQIYTKYQIQYIKLKLIKTVVLAQEWANRLMEEKRVQKKNWELSITSDGISNCCKLILEMRQWAIWKEFPWTLFHYLISTIKYFPDGIQTLNVKKK